MLHVFLVVSLSLWKGSQGEPYEYSAACLPTDYINRPDLNRCTLYITSPSVVANVTIATSRTSNTVALLPGVVLKETFGQLQFPVVDVESKAIRIQSDTEIQVLVYKSTDLEDMNDVYQVPSRQRSGQEYYTTAYVNNACTSSNLLNHFYLVTTFYDDTTIEVTEQNGDSFVKLLPSFGTFVVTTAQSSDYLASGTRVTSSSPVNVVSGNLCEQNLAVGSSVGTYASSIPPVNALGTQYMVPKIVSEDDTQSAGYSVTVVATQDDTEVSSNGGEAQSLMQGETLQMEYLATDAWTLVQCSKSCMVTQFSKSISYVSGLFMQTVIPVRDFYTSSFFSTLDITSVSHLSIVLSGKESGDDLFLNGESLGYLEWTPGNGFATAELSIPAGTYALESLSERPFAAYVYCHKSIYVSGAGYAVLPVESGVPLPSTGTPEPTTPELTTPELTTPEPTTPEPTTPEPTAETDIPIDTTFEPSTPEPTTPVSTPPPLSGNYTLPLHTVRMNGTALTLDGANITPLCAIAHLQNLELTAGQMIPVLNGVIGNEICTDTSGVLSVVSSRATMIMEGAQTAVVTEHVLKVDGSTLPPDVERCSAEISSFLSDLGHWPQPVFPEVPDCSLLLMVPQYFDPFGHIWTCTNTQDDEQQPQQPESSLLFESKVSEALATTDGSQIDIDCSFAYSDACAVKTRVMLADLERVLTESPCSHTLTVDSKNQAFVSFGSQAVFQASFYYSPSSTADFDSFRICVEAAHAYTQQHENWGGPPFLLPPPGCPLLEHGGDTLINGGLRWACPV